MDDRPIGVMDSGVGGLTVLRELERVMPQERYLYYGDNGHCPFGNRGAEEMLGIIGEIMGYFQTQGVKGVVLACNTSSALLHRYEKAYPFPIFSIITPVARSVTQEKLREVGVIATAMTVNTKAHAREIQRLDPVVEVYAQASLRLAALVDDSKTPEEDIQAEVQHSLGALLAQHPVKDVILGCTHYPIVTEAFVKEAPGVRFIDPAAVQAQEVREYFVRHNRQASAGKGRLDIVTTGSPEAYPPVLRRLGLRLTGKIQKR